MQGFLAQGVVSPAPAVGGAHTRPRLCEPPLLPHVLVQPPHRSLHPYLQWYCLGLCGGFSAGILTWL